MITNINKTNNIRMNIGYLEKETCPEIRILHERRKIDFDNRGCSLFGTN